MKHFYMVFLLFAIYNGYTQQTLSFNYDESGNQKIRQIICINCRTANNSPTDDINEVIMEKSSDFPQITFYPNPVKEELFLKWQITNDLYVNAVEVYNLQGQLAYSNQNVSQGNTLSIAFRDFAQGMYSVLLIYNNGEKKDLKIIKK